MILNGMDISIKIYLLKKIFIHNAMLVKGQN